MSENIELEEDYLVEVPRSVISLHWKLTHTREWPIDMMVDLAKIKDIYTKAILAGQPKETANDQQPKAE